MRRYVLFSLIALAACAPDETVFSYGAGERVYALQRLDGAPFTARATIGFPEPGRIAGQAPCNSYGGAQLVPYPWFETGPLMSTKRACPDLAAEGAFFAALDEMSLAQVNGTTLRLWNDAGREMLFSEVPGG